MCIFKNNVCSSNWSISVFASLGPSWIRWAAYRISISSSQLVSRETWEKGGDGWTAQRGAVTRGVAAMATDGGGSKQMSTSWQTGPKWPSHWETGGRPETQWDLLRSQAWRPVYDSNSRVFHKQICCCFIWRTYHKHDFNLVYVLSWIKWEDHLYRTCVHSNEKQWGFIWCSSFKLHSVKSQCFWNEERKRKL